MSDTFSCGRKFSVGINKIGDAFVWGDNTLKQLGLDNVEYTNVPIRLPTRLKWSRVCCGDDYTIGIASSGDAYMWGTLTNEHVYPVPTKIPPPNQLAQWESFSCGATHVIGKTTDGEFYGWGNNSFGQLNIINAEKHLAPKPPQVEQYIVRHGDHYLDTIKENIEKFPKPTLIERPGPNVSWEEFHAGFRFTIGKASDGKSYISGHHVIGQDTKSKIYNVRFAWNQNTRLIPTPDNSIIWKTFYVGPEHIIGMTTSGQAYAIGDNRYGELGLGDRNHRTEFQHLPPSGAPWREFYLGLSHTIGVSMSGKAFAWGNNRDGRLGLLESADKIVTFPHILVPPAKSIWISFVTGHNHIIGINSKNILYSFGSNDRGQLGLGDTMTRALPHVLTCPVFSWAFTPRDTNYNDLYEAAIEERFTDFVVYMKDDSTRHVHSSLISLQCPALLDTSTHHRLSDVEMDQLIKLCYGVKPLMKFHTALNIYRYLCDYNSTQLLNCILHIFEDLRKNNDFFQPFEHEVTDNEMQHIIDEMFSKGPLPDFRNEMVKLLDNHCDFSIAVSNGVLAAHKFVLSTRSEYFNLHLQFTMKSGNHEQMNHANLSDTPLSTSSLKQLLHYFYTTKVSPDLTAIESFEILLTKDFLRLESGCELIVACEEKFEITPENHSDILALATKWDQDDVIVKAMEVMYTSLKNRKGWGRKLMELFQ